MLFISKTRLLALRTFLRRKTVLFLKQPNSFATNQQQAVLLTQIRFQALSWSLPLQQCKSWDNRSYDHIDRSTIQMRLLCEFYYG